MGIGSLFILAVGLSMDAFAVAICKGLAMGKSSLRGSVIVGLWFGFFQALMPLIGYFIGIQLSDYIKAFDHWVAFVLLAAIGISMIAESRSKKEEEESPSLSVRSMFPSLSPRASMLWHPALPSPLSTATSTGQLRSSE